MISLLRISGFALIDELELDLSAGLTVITGETGAGKSIIVEAVGLLRGGRSSTEVIRSGVDEARVEAVIDLPAEADVRAWLDAEGRTADEGLVVRRTVSRAGRGRVHLGGSLATASDLGATVGRLVDIASQHDQQSLTDPDAQLAILDAFAEHPVLLAEMTEAHRAAGQAAQVLAAFDADARTRGEREDLLRFQLGEIAELAPRSGEDDALRAERERLRSAEKFFAAATRGEEVLYSGEGAVTAQITAVARSLEPLAALDPGLAPLGERLRGAQAVVEDVAADLGRYASGIRADPSRQAEVEERLYRLSRLVRKHGGTLDDVITRRDQLDAELAVLGSFEDGLRARREALEAARGRAQAAGDALTGARRQAAADLGRRISKNLGELGLGRARIDVVVDGREAGPRGADRVTFLFAPNPGEEPRPLGRIASGGELSRVMLAVKQALARTDQVLTYIFDEVDAGVGGGTAAVIGRKLKKIAAERQVVTITHLAQIAAFADHHLRVEKRQDRGRTVVTVEALSGAGRTREIARMLGGSRPSAEALAHADEMLRRARN